MKIAFDAKRIFQNKTGLGNYSRTLVNSLSQQYPNNKYLLFAPKKTDLFSIEASTNMEWVGPGDFWSKRFPSLWRSKFVCKDLNKSGIDIYHGLSHEIPYGIQHTKTKSVVTIHDLIFERYPQQYNPIDVFTYRKKIKNACKHSNHVIAISEQTKKDLIDFYQVDSKKITVCYQSCASTFFEEENSSNTEQTRIKYKLPNDFFLFVGSVIERKNLLAICKAMLLIDKNERIPLIVIGKGGSYLRSIKHFLQENELQHDVRFLSENTDLNQLPDFLAEKDFASIYRCATALIYPSVFEGFGIPILEAMAAGTPVITSDLSCMPEVGGEAVLYVDPLDDNDIASKMKMLINDTLLKNKLSIKGKERSLLFTAQQCAEEVMKVYLNL
jgi:glycosyltransferase involved in cell wall biosynthesis